MRIERWWWLGLFCLVSLGIHLGLVERFRSFAMPVPPPPPAEIEVSLQPDMAHSVAALAIQLDDGTTLEATHDSGVPWADVAKQRRALETKFDSLVTPILGAAGAKRLHDAIERIDSLDDVGDLARASTK